MAFPTTSILDNFNRSNEGPPPSGSWSNDQLGYGDSGLQVVSNQCKGVTNGSGNYHSSYWNTTTGANCEVYITVQAIPSLNGELIDLHARLQATGTTGVDGYILRYTYIVAGTDTLRMYEVTNQTETQIGSTVNQDLSAGDKLGFELVGSTLKAYVDTGGGWTEVMSRTDSTHSSGGHIGLSIEDNDAIADDFGGGTVVVPGAVFIPQRLHPKVNVMIRM